MNRNLHSVNRRWILAGGTAGGFLVATGVSAQPANLAPNFKVVVTANGGTYTYPGGPGMPSYYVGIRLDGRIVFHLGALGLAKAGGPPPTPFNLGLHHVRIEKDGAVLLDVDIPSHWWNAEWTYRPQPIAIKRTPAQIVAANRMFPFGDTGAKIPAQPTRKPYSYMGSSDITKYMPTTGERPDIGLITDNSGYFMLGKDAAPMIDWALSAGSCPMHFRDEETGKPVDLLKYPQANSADLVGLQGAPFMLKGTPDLRAPAYSAFGGDWTPQQAHYYEMSYLAHVATGDTGFLEDLQYSANFTVHCDASRSTAARAIVSGEYRGIAWAFRNLFMAHVATQDAEANGTLPTSCHPSSYWKKLLDNQREFFDKNRADPTNQTFRLVGGPWGRFAPWQVDYMLLALAFGILTGHSDWTPLYLWALKNAIDRTSGKSGYPPGWGTAYYLNTVPYKTDPKGKPIKDDFDNSKPQFDWKDAFLYQQIDPDTSLSAAQIATLNADPLNGGKVMQGYESLMATRAVLVMAAHLEKKGLVNVRGTYPELDQCISNVEPMTRSTMNPRASVVVSS